MRKFGTISLSGFDTWLDSVLDLCSAVIGLLGIVFLTIPALYIDRYARLLMRLRRLPIDDQWTEARAGAEASLVEHRDGWNIWKRLCLLGGTALTGISFVVIIFRAARHL